MEAGGDEPRNFGRSLEPLGGPETLPVCSCQVPVSAWMDEYLRICVNSRVANTRSESSLMFKEQFPDGDELTFEEDARAAAEGIRRSFCDAGLVYRDRFIAWDGFTRADSTKMDALHMATKGMKQMCAPEGRRSVEETIGLLYCGTRAAADAIAAGDSDERSLPPPISQEAKDEALTSLSVALQSHCGWFAKTPLPQVPPKSPARVIFCSVWTIRDVAFAHRDTHHDNQEVRASMNHILRLTRRVLDAFATDIEEAGFSSGVISAGVRVTRSSVASS